MSTVKSVQRGLFLGFMISILTMTSISHGATKHYKIILDADFTTTKAAGIAIKQGINTALSEKNYQISGYQFTVETKDHRGNSRRSKQHLKQYLADSHALVVFGGLHSPPLLANKKFINQQQILTLVPWAAAGPITRSAQAENWIFRLSIDDSNAGHFIAKQAVAQGFKRPYLLLEDTGWGKSNENTMTKSLAKLGVSPVGIGWFNWGIKENQARIIIRSIINEKADVIFFVGNSPEGKVFANALLSLDHRLAIRSHWGITGGDFEKVITAPKREKLDLQFIQTKFSYISTPETSFSRQVFKQAQQIDPSIITAQDIKAPAGFIHAYDLTKILIAAIEQAGLTGDVKVDKLAIHRALEQLTQPVKGLIKEYRQPFSGNHNDQNSHEALSAQDYGMASYGDANQIILHPNATVNQDK